MSQCAFAAFCVARGYTPTKAQVETTFRTWGTAAGFTLSSTQKDAGGREVWKQRRGSKLTCAVAPPCTRAPPRCAAPTTPPAAGDRNFRIVHAPTSLPSDFATYREGLQRLGEVPPTGSAGEWNGTFSPEQWDALIAKGKARLASRHASCRAAPFRLVRPLRAT